jgi:CRISPR/Cas system endoribonuclease Cas6 (RAMP superfamily)
LKGPIVVEQWLPNKPAPKRITYRHVDREQFAQNEHERLRNRYIEYTKPHTTIEVEIVRLPIIKLRPEEYQSKSSVLTQLDTVRSFTHDPNTIQWRI